jgi:outer membrane protein assembly factor BamB
MQLLERDIQSAEYRASLREMLITELAAEWQRAVNPDDADSFAKSHGGVDAVKKRTDLRQAYERRDRIVTQFLALMRDEYARRKQKAPFDEGTTALEVPKGKGRAPGAATIEMVHPVAAAARQWYRWRGPTGQGNVSQAAPLLRWSPTENVVWKTRIPDQGNSSPVIWENHIFLTSATPNGRSRSVLCVSRADGRVVWQRSVPVAKIERMIRDKNGYASATPVTDGKRVWSFLGNAGIVCLDFEGNLLWRTDLGSFDGTWGPGASPVLYDRLVILVQDQSEPSSLAVALDKNTGKIKWRRTREAAMGWCTPVVLRINGRDELIFTSNRRLIGCDPRTGDELWFCGGPTHEPIPSIVTGAGMIFCSSGRNGPTLAVRPGGSGDIGETHLVWSAIRGGPHVPSPVYVAGFIYLVSDRGILSCLDAETGRTVYQKRLDGVYSASPIATPEYVYFTNEAGETRIVPVGREFNVFAANPLNEPVLASLAVHDGRIFARSANHLWCLGPP